MIFFHYEINFCENLGCAALKIHMKTVFFVLKCHLRHQMTLINDIGTKNEKGQLKIFAEDNFQLAPKIF